MFTVNEAENHSEVIFNRKNSKQLVKTEKEIGRTEERLQKKAKRLVRQKCPFSGNKNRKIIIIRS